MSSRPEAEIQQTPGCSA